MKRLFNVIVLTLAMNFLALAGAVGWIHQQSKIDRAKIAAIKAILLPKTANSQSTTKPTTGPATQPMLQLDELLAKAAGRSASEKVDAIHRAFDVQMGQLDRRQSDVLSLQRQVELAQQQLTRDRASLESQRKALDAREKQATRLAGDKGFQDSLTLYLSLPAKQVKTIFGGLDDTTVMNYLQAMPPRSATKIVKEFTSPDEIARIQKIMEQMRLAQASAKE
jgi:superfamily II RNA helicase